MAAQHSQPHSEVRAADRSFDGIDRSGAGPDSEATRGSRPYSFRALLDAIESRIAQIGEEEVFQRDPLYIQEILPRVEKVLEYFRPNVRGFENLPKEGPFLVVGNHCGGIYTPEAWLFLLEWMKQRGVDQQIYGLTYDLLLAMPIGRFFRRLGSIPASMDNARAALERGAAVLVYPGGDHEAFRPWGQRARIDFAGRQGFIKLALELGIPIVPVVAHGAHEATVVVARGRRLARAMGLPQVRVKIFPFTFGLPWGLVPGFVPTIPLPTRITLEVGQPIYFGHSGRDASSNPLVVNAAYQRVVTQMQTTLDKLQDEEPHPWEGGLQHAWQTLRSVAGRRAPADS